MGTNGATVAFGGGLLLEGAGVVVVVVAAVEVFTSGVVSFRFGAIVVAS